MAANYVITCWHCLAEFDAAAASWCSHSNRTKICPYCLKCFCDASLEYKKNFLQSCPPEMVAEMVSGGESTYLKIGEVLMRAGKITEEQLQKALQKQRILRKKLGEILMMMSLVTPDELQLYLLNQKNLEEVDLKSMDVDLSLVDRVGRSFCLEHQIVPIDIQEMKDGEVLRFAFYSLESLGKLKKDPGLRRFRLIPYMAKKEDVLALLGSMGKGEKEVRLLTPRDSADSLEVLNGIIKSAIASEVSDVYFELKSDQMNVYFQMEEGLRKIELPEIDAREFFAWVKQVAGIKTSERDVVQKSFMNLSKKFSHFRIRIFYFPSANQENLRFKIINLKNLTRSLKELPLDVDELEQVQDELKQPSGFFLMINPKSDKLQELMYTLMHALDRERIASVETRVLLRNERFFQIENDDYDVLDKAFQNLLFFKPDSMFLFDFMEKSYHKRFLDFAKSKKLFLGVKGISYEEIFEKLSGDMNVPLRFVLDHLRLLIFETSVKILCPACKQVDPLPASRRFPNLELSKDYSLYIEKGCPKCNQSGFNRSEPVYEVFVLKDSERRQLRENDLRQLGQKISASGNLTISQKVMNRVLKGDVSFSEFSRFF